MKRDTALLIDRLHEAMRERHVNQFALSQRVGASQGTISKILAGKTANSRLLPRIASELGVTLTWLSGIDRTEELSGFRFTLEELEWIDLLRGLPPEDRQTVVKDVRSLFRSVRRSRSHAPHMAETAGGEEAQDRA